MTTEFDEIDLEALLEEIETDLSPMGIDVTPDKLREMAAWCKKYLAMKYGERGEEIGRGMKLEAMVDLWMTAHVHGFEDPTEPTYLC